LCQGLHFVNLVPSPPRQMPSAHWGEYGLNLSLANWGPELQIHVPWV